MVVARCAMVRIKSMEEAIDRFPPYANIVGEFKIDVGVVKEPSDFSPGGEMKRFMMMC
jgi:hypothetical protein